MPKNQANVKQVLAASKDILAKNGGRMPYEAWRDAVAGVIGEFDNALAQIVSNKMMRLELVGFDADGRPALFVVAEVQ